MPDRVSLSIIVPVYNEYENIPVLLTSLCGVIDKHCELIFVDGGSDDGSLKKIKACRNKLEGAAKVIVCESGKGRAQQMNTGASLASGDILMFLHADTRLPQDMIQSTHTFRRSGLSWGRFDVKLDTRGFAFSMIAWMMNWRSRLSGIATGDQCIFVKQSVFHQVMGFPDQALMEDIELSRRLKKVSRPYCVRSKVLTSARKWREHGVLRTIWLMWRLRAAYALGVSAETLVKQYYT